MPALSLRTLYVSMYIGMYRITNPSATCTSDKGRAVSWRKKGISVRWTVPWLVLGSGSMTSFVDVVVSDQYPQATYAHPEAGNRMRHGQIGGPLSRSRPSCSDGIENMAFLYSVCHCMITHLYDALI